MNSVESAASLFGSDDTGPDPFAVLGGDDPESTTAHTADNVQGDTLSAFHKPGVDAAAENLFSSEDLSLSSQHSSELEPTSHDPYAYDASNYSQDLSSSVPYNDQAALGWYDEYGQWQTQESLPMQPAETIQEYTTSQHPGLPSSQYGPYAPQANTMPGQSYAPQTQPTYTPYQQPTSTSTGSETHTQVQTSSSQPAYNPYTPSPSGHQVTSNTNSSYSFPSSGQTSYATVPKTTTSVPAPPTPSAAVYRPKTLNAYDPPLPPPRASRRAVSTARPPRAVSPAVGQQTYPLYNVSSLTPPPPHPANYNAYSASHSSQAYSSHAPLNTATLEDSTGYQNTNSWNSRSLDNRSANGVSNDQDTVNSVDEFADSANMSSHYVPHADTYAATSSSRLPSSGKTDEPPTPRQLPNGMVVDYTGPQHPQSHTQSAPPSRQVFGNDSILNWETNRGSPPIANDKGFATSFPSAPLPSQENGPYAFSGDTVTNSQNRANARGSYISERAVSPAQIASQSWSESPRASPDSHRISESNPISSSPPPSNYDAYRPSPYDPQTVARTSSPGNEYIRSRNGSEGTADAYALQSRRPPTFDQPESSALAGVRQASPPTHIPNGPSAYLPATTPQHTNIYEPYVHAAQFPASQTVTSDPYAPNPNARVPNVPDSKLPRAKSPPKSWQNPQSTVSDPYAPPLKNGTSYVSRDRSASNGSVFSGAAIGQYAPPKQSTQQSYMAPYPSAYNISASQEPAYEGFSSIGQDVSLAPATATHSPYAPSPSLMGSNDPLGRSSARIPVFSFGFGGKLVTCFHGSSGLNTGFDVALSSRQSTDIKIRVLHKVIPESALDSSTAVFPGPLLCDPGSPTNSLVRTNASQVKAKKTRVSKYLDERADEIHRGIAYLTPGSEDRRQADGKLVLVRLLKIMVENDGQLSGNSQLDTSVRAALLPRLAESGVSSSLEAPPIASALSFSSPIPDSYPGLGLLASDSGENPIAVSTLRPSALTKIQELLLRGERRQAYHFALDENLWAHAMVIASGIDKEAWKEVVNEFLRTELAVKEDDRRLPAMPRSNELPPPATNGREWLRVAYSLFSGQGPAAVQELLPPNQLSRPVGGLQVPVPAISHITPMSPNFPSPSITANIPIESLAKWPETAAVMVSSPMVPDTSAALTALGDYMVSNGWVEAAHACYLLSPLTSPTGGVGSPSTRLVLVGSRSPHHWPSFHKDPDPIIFTEIAEFAMSLAAPPKGQEAFPGLPHLQAYKLIRATSLAEIGQVDLAKRYCEAITTSLARGSPYFTPAFVRYLRGLLDRLIGAPHLDKSGSWIGGKMNKPSLDSIGGWLEGRLTKFIAGDGDTSPAPAQDSARNNEPGVFTHYSAISSTTSSASPSPQPSQMNLHTLPSAPPRRTGSAMAAHSNASPYVPIDRASSAMEYSRPDARRPSPAPRIASANASTTTFAQTPSFGQAVNGYGATNGHVSSYSSDISPKSSLDTTDEEENQVQTGTWWGSSYTEDLSAATPTAATFVRVDEAPASASSSGFISLMNDPSFSVSPSPPASRREQSSSYENEDDEDLGFGNSKRREKEKEEEISKKAEEPAKAAAPERPDIKPAQAASTSSGSWLGRFWKRADSTPGPVKASLGEETSFYYDKELKRWVNRKAGTEDASKPVATPPPPSRSQTASPGRSSSSSSGPAPPTARSVSAVDLSASPPSKSTLRVRSNLVPSQSQSSPNSPAMPPGSGLAPPPAAPGRPRSSASKRNIRSRYVDILQDEGAK